MTNNFGPNNTNNYSNTNIRPDQEDHDFVPSNADVRKEGVDDEQDGDDEMLGGEKSMKKERALKKNRFHDHYLKFLPVLRDYPCLYNKRLPSYKDVNMRTAALSSIADAMGFTGVNRIKRVHNDITYARKRILGLPKTKSGQGASSQAVRSQWDEISNVGSFLKEHQTK